MWCGTALARRACRDGLSAAGPVEPFRVNGFAIRGALRPYVEFIPDALHREDESWRLRVRLYLAPQAGDEHIDAAVIGFRATPRNGVTEAGHATGPGEDCLRRRSAARSRRGSAALPGRCHRQRYGRPGRACSPRFLPAPGQFHRPCSLATPL